MRLSGSKLGAPAQEGWMVQKIKEVKAAAAAYFKEKSGGYGLRGSGYIAKTYRQ